MENPHYHNQKNIYREKTKITRLDLVPNNYKESYHLSIHKKFVYIIPFLELKHGGLSYLKRYENGWIRGKMRILVLYEMSLLSLRNFDYFRRYSQKKRNSGKEFLFFPEIIWNVNWKQTTTCHSHILLSTSWYHWIRNSTYRFSATTILRVPSWTVILLNSVFFVITMMYS